MTEKFHLFYNGPFSQWSSSPFEIGGIKYNCAEQYMMAEKARLHGATDIMAKVMAAEHPAEQKALGRSIPNYDNVMWKQEAKLVVYRGSYAKYQQNLWHHNKLSQTKGLILVEASPTDVVWGIGLSEDDPDAYDRTKWKGTNWLGEVLTQLRIDLMGS